MENITTTQSGYYKYSNLLHFQILVLLKFWLGFYLKANQYFLSFFVWGSSWGYISFTNLFFSCAVQLKVILLLSDEMY